MKLAAFSASAVLLLIVSARADLTIVQKVEGPMPMSEMTMKIKGDKARIDAGPQMTSIMDAKTGEAVTLMHEQKMLMRMSAEQAKAAAAAVAESMPGQEGAAPVKITPSGKKETINGFETEEYLYETPAMKASYWIAKNYPNADSIMKQMQALNSQAMTTGPAGIPDFRHFPGLPVRTNVSMGGQQFVTTVTSVKHDPLNAADFTVPSGSQEIKMPDMSSMMGGKPDAAAKPSASPKKK